MHANMCSRLLFVLLVHLFEWCCWCVVFVGGGVVVVGCITPPATNNTTNNNTSTNTNTPKHEYKHVQDFVFCFWQFGELLLAVVT
jgi:hypothetical protein